MGPSGQILLDLEGGMILSCGVETTTNVQGHSRSAGDFCRVVPGHLHLPCPPPSFSEEHEMNWTALIAAMLLTTHLCASTEPATTLGFTPVGLGFSSLQDAADPPPTPTPQAYGTQGTTRWGLFGDFSDDGSDEDNRSFAGGLIYEFFVADDLSFNLEFDLSQFNQEGGNTWGVGGAVMLRWHFSREDDSTLFVEGGVGALVTGKNVPIGGSDFNFTPRAGVGFTHELDDGARLVVAFRWYHISNANTYPENPGRDSAMVWVGWSWPLQ
jgi:lipid A 3-O-deacylase